MKKLPRSVWITALMSVYAVVFFVYQFGVRHVGFSPRNIAVLVGAIVLILAVWLVNRSIESRGRNSENRGETRKENSEDEFLK
jgi:uncharacterized membrane protein (DUF2068 family)